MPVGHCFPLGFSSRFAQAAKPAGPRHDHPQSEQTPGLTLPLSIFIGHHRGNLKETIQHLKDAN